jgi:hypothetical protein
VKRELVLVAGLAVALRLAWVLAVPTHPVGDFAMYLESADYLVEHHALDPEFIYMPGYVFLLALVRGLGGGLLAAKLIGVAAGGLVAAAAYGTARALFEGTVFDPLAARVSGLLAALWPAGIAVSSVTGTDLPAGALLAAAVWLLARDGRRRPLRASILFGLLLGLAATIRAVALPAALLGALYWLALRVPLRQVAARTAVGAAVALLVLLPWGIRNTLRYGEFFLTDSHGGHTALVGANPNSEGTYSRSLNQMFWKGTGYRLFAPPHRDADRAAYALAKRFARFEPAYAVGLLAAKADRLLTNERPLLYWPLYRQGVLRGPAAGFFALHRAGIEALADGFWYVLGAAVVLGVVVALSRRAWPAVALLAIPAALAGVYVLFFAEVRYHLAVVPLLFPFAGLAVAWAVASARELARRRPDRRAARELVLGALAVAALFFGWPRMVAAGAELRARHRWAACACEVSGHGQLCLWRPEAPAPGTARSPLRGVWDGIGITPEGRPATVATDVDGVPPGRYRVSAQLDAPPGTRVIMRAAGVTLAPGAPATAAELETRAGVVDHAGGPLRVEVTVEAEPGAVPTVWLYDMAIGSDLR